MGDTFKPQAKPVTGWSDHCLKDAQCLALHCKIAHKIDRNPELLERVKREFKATCEEYGDGELPHYYREWQCVLDWPWPTIAAFLIAVTEDAIRLRSSTPFQGVLTQAERMRIFEAFRP